MALKAILALLSLISCGITIWQWIAARRFPLHQRSDAKGFTPSVTILKPLKGCDSETEGCLQSWMELEHAGSIEILFGVATDDDPACEIVNRLIRSFPDRTARLILCPTLYGANAKVSKLIELEKHSTGEVIVISDADVRVAPDFLASVLGPLSRDDVGLVNCFYALTTPEGLAMQWESIAINADFWSQVLQSQTLKPLDFALGATMATKQSILRRIGGFNSIADYLADDYLLGNKISRQGLKIILSPIVVECRSAPMTFVEVWEHQLRWSRTIRSCQPFPYFISIISNATLWPILWLAISPSFLSAGIAAICLLLRVSSARSNFQKLAQTRFPLQRSWMILMKDILHLFVWALSFLGNEVEWRGKRYKVYSKGLLVELPTQ